MFLANQKTEGDNGVENARSGPANKSPRPAIVCRRMTEDDFDDVIDALERGFPERPRVYWARGLQRMKARPAPTAYPRYGYVMTAGDSVVGVILLIFSEDADGTAKGNVSSWYVDPAFRGFSHMLLAIPLRLKGATFINISPTPSTIETIVAQGFRSYVEGTFHAFPALAGLVSGAVVRDIEPDPTSSSLLARHASYGCLSFEVCCGGETYPFIFQKSRLFHNKLRCAQLVHCRSVEEFIRFAGPLGRRLLRLGFASVILDANEPLKGLFGHYVTGRRRKYYRGEVPPALNDLTDTELVLFGI